MAAPKKTSGGVKDKDGLTPKQRKFCYEYIKDQNKTQAAIRAGYAPKRAKEYGFELYHTKPNVRKKIRELLEPIMQQNIMTATEIVNELSLIGRSDIADYVDTDPDCGTVKVKGLKEIDPDASRVIKSIEENRSIVESEDGSKSLVHSKFKFNLHDKIKALKMLANYRGLLKENHINIGVDLTALADQIIENDDN